MSVASRPGHTAPMPAPAQIMPKADNRTPTANFKELSNRLATGSWKVFPSSTTRSRSAAAPAVTGTSRPDPPAPSALTMDTTSTSSKITTFNAIVVAIPLKPRSHLSALAVLQLPSHMEEPDHAAVSLRRRGVSPFAANADRRAGGAHRQRGARHSAGCSSARRQASVRRETGECVPTEILLRHLATP